MPRFAILTRLFRIYRCAVLRCGGLRAGETIFVLAVLSLAIVAPPSIAQNIVTMRSAAQEKKPLNMVLRSIAIVEWAGPKGHPTASRLIPIAVYTNDEFLDGNSYLSQPVPLAVQKGTEYILQSSGVIQGTYVIDEPQRVEGIWLGIGNWEPLTATPAKTTVAEGQPSDISRPVLHLRPPDPDRPRMAYDQAPAAEASLPDTQQILSSANRQQIVAISDSSDSSSRTLAFHWVSAATEHKMRTKIQAIAQTDLENSQQQVRGAVHSAGSLKQLTVTTTDFRCFVLQAGPKFVNEIPTCIVSAENRTSAGYVTYITLIARPDIYGTPRILSYAIAQEGKLDVHPRARLVDAVNATGTQDDADLLVELEGNGDRRFGIYRVTGDQVELVYVTGKLPF